MEVGKIQPNIIQRKTQSIHGVSFAGGQRVVDSSVIKKTVIDKMPPVIKLFEKLKWLKGEAGGILINALGTGLVAPIFIAFNPLSDKDEDTKKYTALRQPVSAVLAILIQLGLTKPLTELYDKLCNKGELGKSLGFNQEKLHSESHWKRELKKAKVPVKEDAVVLHRKADVAKVANELMEKGYIEYSGGRKLEGKNLIDSINSALEERIKKQDEIIDDITPKKIEVKSKRAFVLVKPENKDKIRSLCDELKNVEDKPKAIEIIEDWIEKVAKNDDDLKEIADEFLRRDEVLDIRERAVNTIKKIGTFEQAIKNSAILKKQSDELIKSLHEYKTSPKTRNAVLGVLKEIAQKAGDNNNVGGLSKIIEVLEKTKDENTIKAYINKFLVRISDYAAAQDLEETLKIYQTGHYTDERDAAVASKNLLNSLKIKADGVLDNIKEVISNISKKLKLESNAGFEKEVITELRAKIEKKVKGFNQVTNILVGLFITLPITCYVLNWIYPRFMDIFFPELSNSKKSEAPEEKAKAGGKK